MSRAKTCRWCGRDLDDGAFPVAPGKKRAKSDYCGDCWRWPLTPDHRLVVLRHRIRRLSCARSVAQPSLFPGLVERVLVGELAEYRAELAELERNAA